MSLRNMFRFCAVLALLCAVMPKPVTAGTIPVTIHLQGSVSGSGGDLDGDILTQFSLYQGGDPQTGTGGVLVYRETVTLTYSGGLFSHVLGTGTAVSPCGSESPCLLTGDDYDTADPVYIALGILGETLLPWFQANSVPFAVRSENVNTVDGSLGGVITGDVSIQSDLDLDGDLRVTGKTTIGSGNVNTGENAFVVGVENEAIGNWSSIGGGRNNNTTGLYSTVGGGGGVLAEDGNSADGDFSVVSGGLRNTAGGENSVIAGGHTNWAPGPYATIGGGMYNKALGPYGMVAGGIGNSAGGFAATVGGGDTDTASGNYATVPGGFHNTASAFSSFAAGSNAKAKHDGTFVWADWTGGNFISSGVNQFLIRASGGVGIGLTSPSEALDVNGTTRMTGFKLPTGATSGYVLTSDANGIGTWQAAGGGGWVDGGTAVRLENSTDNVGIGTSSPSEKLDVSGNLKVSGGIVAGGKATFGSSNTNIGSFGFVGGGFQNTAGGYCSFVIGGYQNAATASYANVGGGYQDTANGNYSVVAGGRNNIAIGNNSTISGGYYNRTSGSFSTVPGGYYCSAAGDKSLAAGAGAKANHSGSVVIAASSDGHGIDSTYTGGANQMVFRADGGLYITNWRGSAPYDNTKLITTRGGAYLSGWGTNWTNASDRDRKENFSEVDRTELLEKIAALPITRWNYKDESREDQHIGPVAQDFNAIFNVGSDDKSISTVDPAGIALAAIQKLYETNKALSAQVDELHERIAMLETVLEKLHDEQ